MKTTLVSFVAAAVLIAGAPAAHVNKALLPPWVCDIIPVFCKR